MAEQFVDRKSTYPNRYKLTKADGTVEYVTLERADSPTVTGTPLNAETFNAMMASFSEDGHEHEAADITSGTFSTARIPNISMGKGGTGATNGADGLKNLLAAGSTVLSYHQFGDKLPGEDGQAYTATKGRIFFKKVAK